MKPVGIKNNIQPSMEDKGNNANALSCSGSRVGVAAVVARRMVRAVLRAMAVAVAEKTKINQQWKTNATMPTPGGD